MPPLRPPLLHPPSPAMLPLLLCLLAAALPWAHSVDIAASDLPALEAVGKGLGVESWTGSQPCGGGWQGVTCSSDGRVSAIQLGNRKLTGSLSPGVANLTGLTKLELQFNSLSGPLPDLSGLTLLQSLLLHNNLFTSIPNTFFSGLSSVQIVSLDNNPFQPWFIPDSLSSAASLVNFSAVSTNLTGTIPDFLATNFPSFNHLALSFNSLTGAVPPSFSSSPLRSLWLNNQQGSTRLTGDIAFLSNMTSLEQVWLHSNDFTGPIPDLSGLSSLTDLELRDNSLTGPVPKSLLGLKSLAKVTLTNNLLQGAVPVFPSSVKDLDMKPESERFCLSKPSPCDARVDVLLSIAGGFGYPVRLAQSWEGNDPCGGNWAGVTCDSSGNITVINFQKMGLNGTISPDFAKITSLQKLLLANNNITGTVPPELTKLPSLKELDVSNNSLWGEVPTFAKNVQINTAGNSNIGKSQPITGPGKNNGTIGSDNGTNSDGTNSSDKNGKKTSAGVIVGALLGAMAGLCLIGLLCFYCYKRKNQPSGRVQSPNAATVIHPRHSGSDPDTVKVTIAGAHLNGVGAAASETRTSGGASASDVHVVEAGNMVISIQVLRNVTNNFSEENVLGRGGFGTVYKGELHDGTKIAVKRMEAGVMGKGLNEFKSEIAVLTKVRHRNLVSLLGYCLDGNERILVYEYMPQGALSRHLFEWREQGQGIRPLEWKKRLSIALDVARGVEYLHSLAHQSFIHRDLKPSNILLGDDMKAKVADFGLVRLAPADGKCCSVETRLAGTFGYLAPEYAVTGRVTTKSDVFSFGVILMELITGRRALDETQPEESMHLVTWFRRMQLSSSKDSLRQLTDPTLSLSPLDEETLTSVSTVAELAGHCCAREPHQRPDMGHAVNVLSTLAESWKPTDQDSDDSYGIDLDMTLPQALKKWQAFEEDSQVDDDATSSFVVSRDNTQTSIPTRPPGFAESFTSADGR